MVIGIIYWAVPYVGGWHIDYAGVTMLVVLGIAMALMAYVLVAGLRRVTDRSHRRDLT